MNDIVKQLERVAELGAKATKRPWESGYCADDAYEKILAPKMEGGIDWGTPRLATKVCPGDGEQEERNFDFIAAAANLDHAALAATLREKDALLAEAQARVVGLEKDIVRMNDICVKKSRAYEARIKELLAKLPEAKP